ncbi:hypothetical protein LLEC1_00759 [Akanthomyces lecanii]|uniref:Uncharacterized protein n=1 Tax=Cordyceps confragosa TaxID=2714763 RepID=A0A179IAV9_CORDF|nr:hypothetical protein LLEC1_00759 [Akanthomyces lecanii]
MMQSPAAMPSPVSQPLASPTLKSRKKRSPYVAIAWYVDPPCLFPRLPIELPLIPTFRQRLNPSLPMRLFITVKTHTANAFISQNLQAKKDKM